MNILPGDNINDDLFPQVRAFGKIGVFANLTFEVSTLKVFTFDDYRRETKARYEKHKLINRTPVLEFLGRDLTEISFEMKFHRQLGVNPRTAARRVRELCEKGTADYLVIGTEIISDNLFVIESCSEAVEAWDGWGKPVLSTVKVKMLEYVERINDDIRTGNLSTIYKNFTS